MILCSVRLQQDPESPKPAPFPSLEPSSGPVVSPGKQQLLGQLFQKESNNQLLGQLFQKESNNCWASCFTRKATITGPVVLPGKQLLRQKAALQSC